MYPELTELKSHCDAYSRWFSAVDAELYSFFSKHHDHGDLRTVFAKVTLLNRVYMTGLERSGVVHEAGLDPVQRVASLLHSECSEVDRQIRRIQAYSAPTKEALADMAEVHGWIAQFVLREARLGTPISFVSKYLHFHAPVVPIYDELASRALGRYINRRFGRMTATADRLPKTANQIQYYRWLCVRFIELWHDVQESRPGTTVKELDHHLWVLGRHVSSGTAQR